MVAVFLVANTGWPQSNPDVLEVRLVTDNAHGAYYFQPAGLYVDPGQTVRFVSVHYFHSVTAYHPENGNPESRIPESARAFDAILGEGVPGYRATVEFEFHEKGTYDFYCRLHESHGEVGRIVVGEAGGPAEVAPGQAEAPSRPQDFVGLSVPTTRLPAVNRILEYLDSQRITEQRKVNLPRDELKQIGNAYRSANIPIPD